jgi:hypothetical protein
LATDIAGATPKTLADLNTALLTTGIKVATAPTTAVTNAGLTNIDVSVNTLFTSTGIKVATMPSVAITNANLDIALSVLATDITGATPKTLADLNTALLTTGIKVATAPTTAVTNAGLSNIDTAINALFTSTGIKIATMPSTVVTNAILTAVEDQVTHYLATKDVVLNACVTANRVQVDASSTVVTNAVLTAVYDVTTHFLGSKDVNIANCYNQTTNYLGTRDVNLDTTYDTSTHYSAVRDHAQLQTVAVVIKNFTINGSDQSPAYTAETSLLSGRKHVWFKNVGAVNIEIANASNSPTDYFTLEPMDSIRFELDPAAASTFTFKYLGTGTVTSAIQRMETK